LRYGSTHVYRDSRGTFWATGDYDHAGKDIDHNIARMVAIMRAENLAYMGKAYDSDIYKGTGRVTDWPTLLYYHHTDHLTAVNPKLPITVVPAETRGK